MILREPSPAPLNRPAIGAAWLLGLSLLLSLPAWSPARPVEPAPVLLSPAAGGGFAASGDQVPATSKDVQEPVAPVPADAPKVKVYPAVAREIENVSTYVGRIEAAQAIEIRPRVGGSLETIAYRAGQDVKKGDLLFEIDSRTFRAEVAKAEAELRRAEARARRCEIELNNTKKLNEQKVVNKTEVDLAADKAAEAAAELDTAKAQLSIANLQLDFTRITAPIDGKAGTPRISPGELVTKDTTVLATLDSIGAPLVTFSVPENTVLTLVRERRAGRAKFGLEPGDPVQISLNEGTNHRYDGQIEGVETRFDSNTGTLRCRAVFQNPDRPILPGMSAQVWLILGPKYSYWIVPASAIPETAPRNASPIGPRSESRQILVVDDQNVLQKRQVDLVSHRNPRWRTVTDGWKKGDRIVAEASQDTMLGTIVAPVEIDLPGKPPEAPEM